MREIQQANKRSHAENDCTHSFKFCSPCVGNGTWESTPNPKRKQEHSEGQDRHILERKNQGEGVQITNTAAKTAVRRKFTLSPN